MLTVEREGTELPCRVAGDRTGAQPASPKNAIRAFPQAATIRLPTLGDIKTPIHEDELLLTLQFGTQRYICLVVDRARCHAVDCVPGA